MGDLLPCPFCGSTNVGEPIRRRPLQVACIDCGGEGPEALTHDDARDRWNTRATPKPRRDPLTDPRPGDVVRFRQSGSGDSHIVAEVSEVTADGVIVLYVGTDEDEGMSPSGWSDWSGFEVEVLHTADEVTP